MRLIFLGSGEFGLPTLKRLREVHEIVTAVSQPDRPAGRGRHLQPTPVAAWASEIGLPLLKSDNVNDSAFVEQVTKLKPDASVVIAFGQKLSPELIGALGKLAVNLHGSLLPKFRGAAPVNWAVLAGEKESGVSVIGLAQRMDAGEIYGQASTPIGPQETAGELHDRLAELGPELVLGVLRDLERGTLKGLPQDHTQASKAPKLGRADGWVDFAAPAASVVSRVHGLTPWPGVKVLWRRARDGKETDLLLRRLAAEPGVAPPAPAEPGCVIEGNRVVVADGAVRLIEVQLPGGKPMGIEEFARGHQLAMGDVLRKE